jgi:hypothetical protein
MPGMTESEMRMGSVGHFFYIAMDAPGGFDIAITLAGAAEGMLETTDLSAAVRKEAEAAGVSSEDTSDALGWLNYLAALSTTHSAATWRWR